MKWAGKLYLQSVVCGDFYYTGTIHHDYLVI